MSSNKFAYGLQGVEEALSHQSETLSSALYKQERFARASGLIEMADWCAEELRGYDSGITSENIRNYRRVSVQWLNVWRQPLNLTAGLMNSIGKIPLPMGVQDLESYSIEGCILEFPAETANANKYIPNAPLWGVNVDKGQIQALLNRIRLEARKRLHDAAPPSPIRDLVYAMPDFSVLVADADLATILSNRWNEANLTFEAGAYLATVILLGSILEGVLLNEVEQNPKDANQANSSPKKADGKVLPFTEWTLDSLISVAHDCGWIRKDMRDFSGVVRDYRNFVHPNKERKEGIIISVSTCRVIWEVVSASLEK